MFARTLWLQGTETGRGWIKQKMNVYFKDVSWLSEAKDENAVGDQKGP